MLKLNLGGNEELEGGPDSPRLVGFTNVDARRLHWVNVVADIRNGLPVEWLGNVDEIRASHVIEHMCYEDGRLAVRYWASFLKVGGLLRIYCPNGQELAYQYSHHHLSCEMFSRYLLGDQDYELNLHRAVYDRGTLNRLVESAGLKVHGENCRPNAYPFDLGVQAVKI